MATAKRAKRADTGQDADALATSLIVLFSKLAYNYKANLLINKRIKEDDDSAKQQLLDDMLLDKSKPFFMASMHDDSAEDHKGWQGLLYVDANATGEARAYAIQHKLKTVQWVTGGPVWFVTRPYCRHYFVQYSLAEVLKGVKPPRRKVGARPLQTPARVNVDYYTDRLQTYEAMYRYHKIPMLKNKIEKTKLLIKKWRNEV